jgi:phytoene dehydrogenase-like protein
MGGLSNAIASAAKEKGAEIKVNAPVARILTNGGRAVGVAMKDGTEYRAAKVVSSVDAHVTFLQLMDPKELPTDFATRSAISTTPARAAR